MRCDHRFTTFERYGDALALVRKRDGSRQAFDPAKLRAGLGRAAHKRSRAEAAVEAIVETVQLEGAAAGGTLSTRRIGELCLTGLREADTVAYLRFATVHKQLADTEAIRAELRALDIAAAVEAEPALAELVRAEAWPPEAAKAGNFTPQEHDDEPVHAQDLDTNEPGREIHA